MTGSEDEQPPDLARLQRIAYGSGATDAERAAAARALAGADARIDRAERPSGDPGPPTTTTQPRSADGGRFHDGSAERDRRTRSRLRWTIVAAAVALACGVLVGWLIGARDDGGASSPGAVPAATDLTYAEYLEALPRVGDAQASEVFTRESISGDALPRSWANDGFFQQRLLLTLPDGTDVFAARREGEVCLILAFPATSGGQSRCTEDGRFPESGIHVVAYREAARFEVAWMSDGTVLVTTDPH
ncbi:hypothetical protein [Agromyces sp. NPDC058110]|uniref:hypothetical protein n=1 Tax=Agromyces sp. NPDC058110 TaxID=3346345 RepID=UPI0036D8401D